LIGKHRTRVAERSEKGWRPGEPIIQGGALVARYVQFRGQIPRCRDTLPEGEPGDPRVWVWGKERWGDGGNTSRKDRSYKGSVPSEKKPRLGGKPMPAIRGRPCSAVGEVEYKVAGELRRLPQSTGGGEKVSGPGAKKLVEDDNILEKKTGAAARNSSRVGKARGKRAIMGPGKKLRSEKDHVQAGEESPTRREGRY